MPIDVIQVMLPAGKMQMELTLEKDSLENELDVLLLFKYEQLSTMYVLYLFVTLQVWVEAGSQICFSYSLTSGTLSVLSSYNDYKNNCYR